MSDTDQKIEILFISSALIFLLLALGVVLFVMLYQRRMAKHRDQLREIQADHRLALLEAAVQEREESQARIAKDLHDDIGALISTVKLHVAQFERGQKTIPGVSEHTEMVQGLLAEGLTSVRRIVSDLLPPTLADFGLNSALKELEERVSKAGQLAFTVDCECGNMRFDSQVELALYRISQELINNTMKHAGATRSSLFVAVKESYIELDYQDDGVGFNQTEVKKNMGLRSIDSRVTVLYEH